MAGEQPAQGEPLKPLHPIGNSPAALDEREEARERSAEGMSAEQCAEECFDIFHDSEHGLQLAAQKIREHAALKVREARDAKNHEIAMMNIELQGAQCELTKLREERDALKDWRDNVSAAIQLIPEFASGEWVGDKEGWGFHFEMVNYCRRERERAESALAEARNKGGGAMISAFVLWLAMAGQGHTRKIVDAYAEAPCKGLELQCNPFGGEHVIEIRTKRTRTGWTEYCYYSWTKPEDCGMKWKPTYCPQGAICRDLYNTRKTLYIDGQKIGVIRETEEK